MSYKTHTFVFYGTFLPRETEAADIFEPFVEHGTPTSAAPGVEIDVIGCQVLGKEQIAIYCTGTMITTKAEQPPKAISAVNVSDSARLVAFLASRGVDASSIPSIGWYLAARTL